MGAAAAAVLVDLGFEVYQEILTPWGPCLDLAGVRGPLLVAVECKVGATYQVMHQALRWMPYAHHCYVAAGVGRFGLDPLCRRLLEDLGLGFIGVRSGYEDVDAVSRADVLVDPRWNRRVEPCLRKCLREEHKTFAPAGSSGAARWSPFKGTVKELREFVRAHPGCTMKEALTGIRHHYGSFKSARGALAHWIRRGRIEGVRIEGDGRSVRLHPEPARRSP